MTLEANGLNGRDELLSLSISSGYCYEKTIHVVLISFEVAFGLFVFYLLKASTVTDPDLQIRRGGHLDPEIRGGGAGLKKKFFSLV